jgi:hypothetical protein
LPIEAHNPRVIDPTWSELGELFRMQDSREHLEAINDARARSCEVSSGVNEIGLAATRSRNGIETRKPSEQFIIASRKIDIVATECENDDLWTGIEHSIPIDPH